MAGPGFCDLAHQLFHQPDEPVGVDLAFNEWSRIDFSFRAARA
jgi:hypothetical protein